METPKRNSSLIYENSSCVADNIFNVFRKKDLTMKKRFAAVFAATAVLGVTTAFAANPFSDVTPDSWAYQAVSQLAASGIVNGYPDGTFKGQNEITRYEMAQMVAKAMANQDRANAEQQAVINRLADEFSAELNNLGVRVSALENKIGNIKAVGDVRLRYQGAEEKDIVKDGNKSLFDMRGRVEFNATVNENTDAVVRVTSGDMEFGDSKSAKAEIDRIYVNHKFGDKVMVTVGRYEQKIGGGLAYEDGFDGARAVIGDEKLNLEVAYGYMRDGAVADLSKNKNIGVTYVGVNGTVGRNTQLGGFWARFQDGYINHGGGWLAPSLRDFGNVYGFNANYNAGKVWVGGEWLKSNDVEDSAAWVAGLGYGNYDITKKGTWDVKAQYFNQKENAPIVSSTWNQVYDMTNTYDGYKGWMATVDYALQNNVGLSAYYGFSGEKQNGANLSDYYRAELNYKF